MSEQNINMDSSLMESDQHTNSQRIPMPGYHSLPIPGSGHSMYPPPGLSHLPPHCPRLPQYIPSCPSGLPHLPSLPPVPGLSHALGLPYAPGLAHSPDLPLPPMTHTHGREKDPAALQENLAVPISNTFRCIRQKHHHQGPMPLDDFGAPFPQETTAIPYQPPPSPHTIMPDPQFPMLKQITAAARSKPKEGGIDLVLKIISISMNRWKQVTDKYNKWANAREHLERERWPLSIKFNQLVEMAKTKPTGSAEQVEGLAVTLEEEDAINERSALEEVQNEPEFQSEDEDEDVEIVEVSDRKMGKVKEKDKEKQETVLTKAFKTEAPLHPKPQRNQATDVLNQISAQLDPAVQQQ
ncbi:hypothetical protein GYMLUDRAFT_265673 [Collybiopsis luxurians FD-317 M1]|uniref:Uncharacterized protein n=1 Tax=Collybiopsis luxurians FD-317 M1 TaxID=944289 RepID=A0A0D0CAE0_9AGAR|nr:hypothetical protein GYMLUDRAFT_265673 [Collybiopsis luxurians FD-317 M1]